ncbi:MAG: hypothetical protein NTV45_02815 [Firmicutes bacterium]|nr:hypothetical protein [Bacillota bacterium]
MWLGIILLLQVIFQVSTGKLWLKVPFIYHRNNGMLLALVAVVHAFYGLGIWFFNFKFIP